jgi:hypothetical protein
MICCLETRDCLIIANALAQDCTKVAECLGNLQYYYYLAIKSLILHSPSNFPLFGSNFNSNQDILSYYIARCSLSLLCDCFRVAKLECSCNFRNLSAGIYSFLSNLNSNHP